MKTSHYVTISHFRNLHKPDNKLTYRTYINQCCPTTTGDILEAWLSGVA